MWTINVKADNSFYEIFVCEVIAIIWSADFLYPILLRTWDVFISATGASFILFSSSGVKKSSSDTKCSIVEDGIVVQMSQDLFAALQRSLHRGTNYIVNCGRQSISVQWMDGITNCNYVSTRWIMTHTFCLVLFLLPDWSSSLIDGTNPNDNEWMNQIQYLQLMKADQFTQKKSSVALIGRS